MKARFSAATCFLGILHAPTLAADCWVLSDLKGHTAFGSDGYVFQDDGFSRPIVLCFEGIKGSVTGDDTVFVRFGESTLAGGTKNGGLELFEVYQIDRVTGKVLLTKTRIGGEALGFGASNLVSSFVGRATPLK